MSARGTAWGRALRSRGVRARARARRGSARSLPFAAVALAVAAVASHDAGAAADAGARTLTVFAAASLADAFREIGARLEAGHPGLRVRFSFAGSQQLAAQIEHGAPADLFASADERWMARLADLGRIDGEPRVFARNRMAVIVPRSNPGRITGIADLARPGVRLVLGSEDVPAGAYARRLLRRIEGSPGIAPGFARRALDNVVSHEENVKSVAGKVRLGEADAGIVYRSDVTRSLAPHIRVIEAPPGAEVSAAYPIAVVRGARGAEAARAFVAETLSEAGRRTLARHGFEPPALTGR